MARHENIYKYINMEVGKLAQKITHLEHSNVGVKMNVQRNINELITQNNPVFI